MISLIKASLGFGGPLLLEEVSFQVNRGDRMCLLGRNGCGKSTLLKILSGELPPDKGELVVDGGLHIRLVGQGIPLDLEGTCLAVASELAGGDVEEHWILKFLTPLGMDPEADFSTLSGGGRRRVLLASALASQPDLLLLDEPTNHLDVSAIEWLEDWLVTSRTTLVFVTHDRAFARRVSNRVGELESGRILTFDGTFDQFFVRRDDVLEAEARRSAEFAKKMQQEETWIRRGVKARLKRDEGRVKALMAMRTQWKERREGMGNAKLSIQTSQKSGDLVAEIKGLNFSWPGKTLIKDLTTTIMRGDKIGVLGPNGAGKTTLIRLLLGQLEPSSGTVRHGTRLEPLFLDQLRLQLDESKTVAESVADGYDTVEVGGKSKHVLAYLQDFLFTPDRAKVPVRILSGGEKNRLLLAKLFTRPANLLVLDEPTNDLDLETLELLEDLLMEWKQTLILVSHDREFLNRVVTSTMVLDGTGQILELAGGWDDWEAYRKRHSLSGFKVSGSASSSSSAVQTAVPKTKGADRSKKMGFKETRELETLPAELEKMEAQLAGLQATLSDPAFYKKEAHRAVEVQGELTALEASIARSYRRWEELEALRSGS